MLEFINNNYLSISVKSEWGENIKIVNDDDCYFILNLKLNNYPFFESFHIPLDVVIILENSILMNENKDFIIDNIKNILFDLNEKDRVSIITFNNSIKQEFTLQKMKGLYSHTFLTKNQFWKIYGPLKTYNNIKNKYDPDDIFFNLYDKAVKNF